MSQYITIPKLGSSLVTTGVNSMSFWVSASGSDGGGSGTQSSPWATIDKARSVIRASGYNQVADVTVNIGSGTYTVSSPTTFAAADSGLNGHTVTYKATTLGGPRFVGGQQLSGWTLHSGSIYKIAISSPVYTLYENGVRARSARTPKLNPGASFPAAFAPYFTSAGVTDSTTVLQYNPVDFDPSPWTQADIRTFVWSVLFSSQIDWFTDTHGLSALDTATKQMTLDNSGLKFNAKSGTAGARYFVQGPLQLLTEAGEFCVSGGFLYYWPRATPIESQEILAPSVKQIISVVGTSASARAHNIVFDGLTMECSDFDSWYRFGATNAATPAPPNDYPYWAQLSIARNGLFYLQDTDTISIRNCHLKNAGFAGVYMYGAGLSNTVQNSLIEHSGTDGVYLEGPTPGTGNIMGRNTLSNLKLTNFGELAGNGMGIQVNQSGYNAISHVTATVGPRNGIRITGWDDVSPTAGMYTTGNTVSYSRITNVCQDSGDCGALGLSFYTRVGVQNVNQVIVDGATAHSSMIDTAPNGVFCDNQSDGQILSNIQVTNTQGNQFRTNDSPAGTHVLTNCSFQSDGSANPSFNPALMDTSNIGVTAGFPY